MTGVQTCALPILRVLVTLAATDANSHLEVMKELAVMFSNPDTIEKIATAKTADEVYDDFVADAEKAGE